MKIILLASFVVLLLVFLINITTYNKTTNSKKDLKEISHDEK